MFIKEEIDIAESYGMIVEAYVDYLMELGIVYMQPINTIYILKCRVNILN